MNKETVKVVVGTASGLIVGGLAGYYFTKNALETKFEKLLDEEVSAVKKFYKEQAEEKIEEVVDQDEELSEEEVALAKRIEERDSILNDHGYSVEHEELIEVEHETAEGSVYTVQSSGYAKQERIVPPLVSGGPIDYSSKEFKDMVSKRTPDKPYIISVDEFMDDNPEFEKQCITYFMADDTLCDDREQIIPDIESTVGNDNLEHFGLYSKDKDIVFVRNERISSDFEIAYDDRSFFEVVSGFKHRSLTPTEDD